MIILVNLNGVLTDNNTIEALSDDFVNLQQNHYKYADAIEIYKFNAEVR